MADTPKLSSDFNAQVEAALMVEVDAVVRVKVASRLCGISRQEIDRRVNAGTFPAPIALSSDEKSVAKGFRLSDIRKWLENPAAYKQPHSFPQI